VALPARGWGRTRTSGATGGSGGSTGLRAAAVAAAATVLAVAILAWSIWREGDRSVVLDMPEASPAPAAPDAPAPDRALAEDEAEISVPAGADPDDRDEPEPAAAVGDPAFFETAMRVVRRSNIRARPTPGSAALGRADEGTMVILVEPKPDRGYFRIATGELEGWIWGANLAPTDPTQQPDPAELSQQADPDGTRADPAAAPVRR
jgi:hypothetical protein